MTERTPDMANRTPAALPAAQAVPVEVPVHLPAEAAGLSSVTVTLTLTPPPPPPTPETPAAPVPVDEAEKGKAARNEQRKLAAAFANGLALAGAGAGLFVPYFTVLSKLPELVARIEQFRVDGFVLIGPERVQLIVLGGTIGAGLFLAAGFRWLANRIAAEIED